VELERAPPLFFVVKSKKALGPFCHRERIWKR